MNSATPGALTRACAESDILKNGPHFLTVDCCGLWMHRGKRSDPHCRVEITPEVLNEGLGWEIYSCKANPQQQPHYANRKAV